MYLLDTNVIIRMIKMGSPSLIAKMSSIPLEQIKICSVVKAELFYGSRKSNQPERSLQAQKAFVNHFESHAFDDLCAPFYAKIRTELEPKGTPIGSNDLMISAIAMTHDLTLVTANIREFSRISNLKLENWE